MNSNIQRFYSLVMYFFYFHYFKFNFVKKKMSNLLLFKKEYKNKIKEY